MGCHGDEEEKEFTEPRRIVEETIELYNEDGAPLPSPTVGRDYANRVLEIV